MELSWSKPTFSIAKKGIKKSGLLYYIANVDIADFDGKYGPHRLKILLFAQWVNLPIYIFDW